MHHFGSKMQDFQPNWFNVFVIQIVEIVHCPIIKRKEVFVYLL